MFEESPAAQTAPDASTVLQGAQFAGASAAARAQLRLTESRERLRLALHRLQATPDPAAHTGPSAFLPAGWLNALRSEPATRVLLDAVGVWWARQPWQQSAALVSALIKQRLAPLAQRSPLGLVLGAFAVGGVVMVLKPWRWISVPTLAAGLLPALIGKVLAQLRPLSWIDLLASWMQTAEQPKPNT